MEPEEEMSLDKAEDTKASPHVRQMVFAAAAVAGITYLFLRNGSPAAWAGTTFLLVILAVNETWHAAKGSADDERYRIFNDRLGALLLLFLFVAGAWWVLCCGEFWALGLAVVISVFAGLGMWRRHRKRR